jgi:iron uptake system EfeUOB component EfeO/EfeM
MEAQTTLLTAQTRRFVRGCRSGTWRAPRPRTPTPAIPYERIEPVAESFGDLDPGIDARAGDVRKAQWTGFHPLEQSSGCSGAPGPEKLRKKLLDDVLDLQRRVKTIRLEPAQVANGAVELLGEVSKSKITGEEERYSHIDLVDFEANVQGAKAALHSVRELVAARRPALATEIDSRFADVEAALGHTAPPRASSPTRR